MIRQQQPAMPTCIQYRGRQAKSQEGPLFFTLMMTGILVTANPSGTSR